VCLVQNEWIFEMSEGFDLRYYLFVVQRRIWHFLLPMLATLALGVGVIVSLPRIYNSSATILVESQKIPGKFVNSSETPATERLQALKTQILARENVLKIVDKFLLFKDRRDLTRNDIVDLMNEQITFDTVEVTRGIRTPVNEKTALVFSIGFDSESPEASSKVANELMTLVMEQDAELRRRVAADTEKFMSREVTRISRELADVDEKISAFKLANSDKLPEKLLFNMQNLDKQQQEIAAIDKDEVAGRNQIRLLEIEGNVRQVEGANRPASANGTFQPGLTLDAQLEQKESELRQAQSTFAKTHPTIRKLEREITALKAQIDSNQVKSVNLKPLSSKDPTLSVDLKLIAQKSEMIEEQLALNVKRRAQLMKSVAELQAVINQTPEIDAQLQALLRSREALQVNLDLNNAKLNDSKSIVSIIDAQIGERFVVVDAPVTPTDPVRPKKLQLLVLALAAALGMGGVAAFGSEYLDSTIRRSRDLKQKLNTRLLVTIPYVKTRAEVRRKRGATGLYLLGFLALLAGILLVVHLFYQPIDTLYYGFTNRF
jgi:polysaccharide biosynthesis transport protein